MRETTIDGVPGIMFWDEAGPVFAFRPHGSRDWSYRLHDRPEHDIHNNNATPWWDAYDGAA